MRRIICSIPRRRVASSSAAGDGGRGRGFLPTDPNSGKPNVGTPHPFVKVEEEAKFTDILGVFVGQSSCFVTTRKQLKNEERARNYCGRATQDDELADEEEKVANTDLELDLNDIFYTNLKIECAGLDHEACKFVLQVLEQLIHKLIEKTAEDEVDDEVGDGARATQNDGVDELAEELDVFLTKFFVTNLMIECEPEYQKHFRLILEKLRGITTEGYRLFVTTLMSECEPEFEKHLLQILERVREKITREGESSDEDEVGNEKIIRIMEKLAELGSIYKRGGFEEKLDSFVPILLLMNIKMVVEKKPYFMVYELIEKVAKKVGNDPIRKIAEVEMEKELEEFVTDLFITNLKAVGMMKPFYSAYKIEEEWEQEDEMMQKNEDALDGAKRSMAAGMPEERGVEGISKAGADMSSHSVTS